MVLCRSEMFIILFACVGKCFLRPITGHQRILCTVEILTYIYLLVWPTFPSTNKNTTNAKTIIVVFSNEKSTWRQNAKRKDDILLGCIGVLSYCRLFVLSSIRGEKTTIFVLSSCRSVVFSKRKYDKTTKRQAKRRQIRSIISGLCLSSFCLYFVVLSTFCFVVLSFFRLFGAKRRS
jgi:hypothetical protein